MRRPPSTTTMITSITIHLLFLLLISSSTLSTASNSPSFGFTLHHRFSDPVKQMFSRHHPYDDSQSFPDYGTVEYVAAMAARDRIHGRRLAAGHDHHTPLTFSAGNTTYRLNSLGFLYYANISIGTPGLDFLVALDTGSDQLWIPCDCITCAHSIDFSDGTHIPLNIYNLNTTTTGSKLPCNSPLCDYKTSCLISGQCPYQISYLSANTSSTGYLVEDLLHLTPDTSPSTPTTTNSNITFGCGQRQTGSFLDGGAPNGLLGLGLDKIAIPSILASQNLTADSFSMCFSRNGIGRISFGDKGSSDQSQTPFSVRENYPTYNISITQISIGKKDEKVDIWAIFDSGTSFTILTEPTYSLITVNFNSQVKEERAQTGPDFPLEFCYALSSCESNVSAPNISMEFKDGVRYDLLHPLLLLRGQSGCFYCLGIIKNEIINIIGQNFMTGYRVIFDREKMMLGWEESDCNYEVNNTTTLPLSPTSSPTTTPPSPPPPPRFRFWLENNSGGLSTATHLNTRFVIWTLVVTLLILIR